METNKLIQSLYIFFVGVLVVLFLGFGINAFYPEPNYPDSYPECSNYSYEEEISSSCQRELDEYDRASEEHDEKVEAYNRNVSIVVIVGSVIFAVVSIFLEKKLKIIADGILLGALFILVYGLIRAFSAGSDKYSFIATTIGLGLVLYLGYHKFVRGEKTVLSKE